MGKRKTKSGLFRKNAIACEKTIWEKNCLWQPNPGVIPDMGHICLPGLCFMPYTGMGTAHGAYSDNLF